jgi:hypothetical protein
MSVLPYSYSQVSRCVLRHYRRVPRIYRVGVGALRDAAIEISK